jgi:hypothetical protein
VPFPAYSQTNIDKIKIISKILNIYGKRYGFTAKNSNPYRGQYLGGN